MSIASILFSLVLGIAMFYVFMNWGKENRIIESWPKTNGKILQKDIKGYNLYIKYEFYVDGVRYESGRIYRKMDYYDIAIKWGKFEDIDKLEFIKNQEVKYNPENPSDCCLILFYEKPWLKVVIFIAGLIFSLVSLFGILVRLSNV
jgi:hypothetical protein